MTWPSMPNVKVRGPPHRRVDPQRGDAPAYGGWDAGHHRLQPLSKVLGDGVGLRLGGAQDVGTVCLGSVKGVLRVCEGCVKGCSGGG